MIKVDSKDVNKEVYFLDNFEDTDNEGIKHCHDNLKEINELNTELFINEKKYDFKKYFIPEKEDTYYIKLKISIYLTDCSYMFAGCKNITNINLNTFNTKYVTNMKYMFHSCNHLKFINNISSFNTQNVSNMRNMFYCCKNLVNLNLSSFNTKNVTNMRNMFSNCVKLQNLDLSLFNTKKVNNMNEIFTNCWELKTINLGNEANNEELINKYKYYQSYSEINILVYVEQKDINKRIYFLDHSARDENKDILQLNESNTELYINNNNYKFNKYFIPMHT